MLASVEILCGDSATGATVPLLPILIRRHDMPPRSETAAPADAERNTLYLAIEISRKSWMVGVKSPASEKIGLHSIGPADVESLRDLIQN